MIARLIVLLLLLPSLCDAAISVSLSAENRQAVALTDTPLKFGVPFAKSDNLLSTSSLGVTGEDAQFRVLSRYDGTVDDATAPIRMVLVDFQDSFTASATNNYTLTDSGSGTAAGALASDQTTYWQIATGTATFQISKTSGNIFESVVVGSDTLVSSPTADKWSIVFGGVTYSSVPDSSEIEENGPMRCVVKIRGHFEDSSNNTLYPPDTVKSVTPNTPVRYTIRYFAYKNKSYVKLQARFENENLGWSRTEAIRMHNMYIDEMYIDTTLYLDASGTVAFDGYSDSTSWSDTYELLQRETSDGSTASYSWSYGIEKNSSSVATGSQYDSYVDVRDSAGGLMVADRWFWQNHPTGFTVTGKRLRYNLLPDTGTDHRILGGMWKTHEIMYYFHGTDTSFDDELAHLKKRPVPRPTADYIASTDFFWGMLPEQVRMSPDYIYPGGESHNKLLSEYETKFKAMYNNAYIDSTTSPHSILDLRDGRLIPYDNAGNYGTWYGYLFFGAMPRDQGYGYHNQHYDWSFAGLFDWLRWDDEWIAYDYAQELLMHKADIIVVHDPDSEYAEMDEGYYMHGGQRYEDWAYTTEYDTYHVGMSATHGGSHFWTKGMVMQYLLTGEYHYMEALEDCWEHAIRVRSTPNVAKEELRHSMRLMDALTHAYQLTGNITYLSEAWLYWKNNLSVYEGGNCTNYRQAWTCTSDEASGYLHTSPTTAVHDMAPSGDAWLTEHVVKLLLTLEDTGDSSWDDEIASLRGFMIRWTDWLRDNPFAALEAEGQGSYQNGNTEYSPWMALGYWDDEGQQYVCPCVENVIFHQPYADLFAWRYTQTGEEWFIQTARELLKDSLWYAVKGYQAVRSGLSEIGTFGTINSGMWKLPKQYTRPALYWRVEAGLETIGAATCATDPTSCGSESECSANWPSYNWCNDTCQAAACSPTCADDPALCLSGDECSANWPTYNWCDGECQVAECSTPTPTTILGNYIYVPDIGWGVVQ